MIRFLILTLVLSASLRTMRGQVWTNLIDSIPKQGWAEFSCSVVDSVNNKLYVAGQFYQFNQWNTNSIIGYDGNSFNTLQTGLDDQDSVFTVVKSMQIFKNKLYVFGTFKKTGSYWCKYIGRWNNVSWDTVNFMPNNIISLSDVYNNELYVAGQFDTIGGIAANCVAKFDGTNWFSLGHPVKNNLISAIKNYHGILYMAGQVNNASSSANLSYWDGSQWIPWVGVSGDNNKAVFGMTVIDSLLYIYGRFNSIGGANCKGLAAYSSNTNTWYGFGAGLSDSSWETIYNVQKVNGTIYVSGNYYTIEDVNTVPPPTPFNMKTNLVKLDGEKWCALGPPFNNVVCGVIGYSNALYAYGPFTQIGTDTVWGFVKWNGGNTVAACSSTFTININPVGLIEKVMFDDLKIYPIPVKDKLRIEYPSFEFSSLKFEIVNSFGQILIRSEKLENNQEVDLSDLSPGIYFLKLSNSKTQKTFKIIKE